MPEYEDIGAFFGVITSIVLWVYFCFAWGPLAGVLLGWIPAGLIAALVSVAWPLALGFVVVVLTIG